MKDYDVMFNVTQAYQELVQKDLSIDIARNNGRDITHLPVPATYIISREGIITAVQFDPDYNNRGNCKMDDTKYRNCILDILFRSFADNNPFFFFPSFAFSFRYLPEESPGN
jgi:hypothetical protein